jgi:hypothetical protein
MDIERSSIMVDKNLWIVKATISHMPSDKAPSSDGFTALFFKKFGDIINNDPVQAIRALECATSRNLQPLSSSSMILLPKTAEAVHPKDFRPISLVHFFAMLFMKVLAPWLRPWMHELVSPIQSAFIKHRVIQNNYVFVHAHAKIFRQTKTSTLMLKLDLQRRLTPSHGSSSLRSLRPRDLGSNVQTGSNACCSLH